MDQLLLDTPGAHGRRRGTAACLGGLLLLVVAAGCGSSDGTIDAGQADPSIGPSEVLFLGRQSGTTHVFLQGSIAECMGAAGFDYEQRPAPSSFVSPDSLEFREEHGFGFSDGSGGPVVEENSVEGVPSSPERLTRLAECDEAANHEINDRLGAYVQSLDVETRAVFDMVADFSHPSMVEAEVAWSKCMEVDGHDFAGPVEMYTYLQRTMKGSATLESEIAIATSDWICTQSPDVKGKVDEAYAELNARLLQSFETVFTEK